MDLNTAPSSLPKQMSKDSTSTQKITPIVIAVIIVLIFIYGVYSVFFQKNSFLLDKLGTPTDNDQVQQINFTGQQTIVTGSQVEVLEKNIRGNEQLQDLELYGTKIFDTQTEGNRNPFKPFDTLTVETPKVPKLDIKEIEKPLPRINNGQ